MRLNLSPKNTEKLRFGLVGVANTALDFSILLTLRSLGIPSAVANFPSSTAAVIFSFFANKNYTFKSKGSNLKREITLFLIVTLFCAWVLQPITIIIVEYSLQSVGISPILLATIAKIVATLVTLVWNYIAYSKFVFISK
jgi:putative flippase GtrA